jgi:TATA-box binding protein (TBP) (component of TFIID and TFIIIB)
MEIPKYRISTITATASLNSEINLDVLYQHLEVVTDNSDGILYVEYGKKKVEMVYKGTTQKYTQKHKNSLSHTKRFDNQVTMVYRTNSAMINSKIFRNGNVQMTGIRSIEQGRDMIDMIIETIHSIYEKDSSVVQNIDVLECCDYKLRLICCDFRFGFQVKRDPLHKLLVNTYGASSSFEPCIYPAVKIKYYYNSENGHQDGNCHCSEKCIVGKGTGHGDKQCKKVTIAMFQSGCAIITGGQSLPQVDEAYEFIKRIILNNMDTIKKTPIVVPSGTL